MDYRYHIQFRSTTKHGNADTLSRFPLEHITQKATDIVASVQQQQFEEIQVSTKQIAGSIRKNPLLAKILSCVKTGWPEEISAEQQPYYQHRRINHRRKLFTERNASSYTTRFARESVELAA